MIDDVNDGGTEEPNLESNDIPDGQVFCECNSCLASFNDDKKPEFCPFCGSTDVREGTPPEVETEQEQL